LLVLLLLLRTVSCTSSGGAQKWQMEDGS